MPALTKPYEAYERPGLVVSYRMSNVRIFKGSLVGTTASGFAVPMSHATGSLLFVGVASETVDNSSGSAGERTINLSKAGSFVYSPASGYTPSQADVGKEVFANTDNEVQIGTGGLTNQYKVGTITGLEGTATGVGGVRVRVERHTV